MSKSKLKSAQVSPETLFRGEDKTMPPGGGEEEGEGVRYSSEQGYPDLEIDIESLRDAAAFSLRHRKMYEFLVFLVFFLTFAYIQGSRASDGEIAVVSTLNRWAFQAIDDGAIIDNPASVAKYYLDTIDSLGLGNRNNKGDVRVADDQILMAAYFRILELGPRRPCIGDSEIKNILYEHINDMNHGNCTYRQMGGAQANQDQADTIFESIGFNSTINMFKDPGTIGTQGVGLLMLYHAGDYGSQYTPKLREQIKTLITEYDPKITLDLMLFNPSEGIIIELDLGLFSQSNSIRREYQFNNYFRYRMHRDSLSYELVWWIANATWHISAICLMWAQVTQLLSIRVWLAWFGGEMSLKLSTNKADDGDGDVKRGGSTKSSLGDATCKKAISVYCSRGWNKVESIAAFLHIWCSIFQLMHFITYAGNRTIKFPNAKSSFEEAITFNFAVLGPFYMGYSWFALSLYVTALHYCFCALRFFHFISWHKGMRVLSKTLHMAVDMVWNVVLVMLTMTFLMGMIAHIWLGEIGGHGDFMTILTTMNSLGRLSFGFYDYTAIVFGDMDHGDNHDFMYVGQTGTGAAEFKIILFWTTIVLTMVFLQNIILATVGTAYDRAVSAEEQNIDAVAGPFLSSLWNWCSLQLKLNCRYCLECKKMKVSTLEKLGKEKGMEGVRVRGAKLVRYKQLLQLTSTELAVVEAMFINHVQRTVFDERECRHLLRVAIANQDDKSVFEVLKSSFEAYKAVHLCQRMKSLEPKRFELVLWAFKKRGPSSRRFSSMSQLPSQMLKVATENNRKADKAEERSLRGRALATEKLEEDLADVKKQLADLTAILQGRVAGGGINL